MRFRRIDRCPFTDTSRKRAALRRRQRLEREAYPLFAALIAEQQPSEDDVMHSRALASARWEQERRDHRAREWRRARAALATIGDNLRPLALEYWNRHRWLSGDPTYLLDMVHGIKTGRLAPVAGGFSYDPGWVSSRTAM